MKLYSLAGWSPELLRYRPYLVLLLAISSFVEAAKASVTAVWANEGGDKVSQEELRATNGQENRTGHVLNSAWNGSAVTLTGAHNEEVSFNLVLENGTASPANNITVSFDTLTGPNGALIRSVPATGDGVYDWTQRPIELFYVRYVQIRGLSFFGYGKWDERQIPVRFQRPYTGQGVGLGDWTSRPDHDKFYPDATVPLEAVQTFTIQPRTNQSIWVDIYLPKAVPSGSYGGNVVIRENGVVVRTIPVMLVIEPFTLPDVPSAKTMINVDPTDIMWRYVTGYGGYANWLSADGAKIVTITDRYFELFHRHKLSLIGEDECPANDRPCNSSMPRLTGSLYNANSGYDGPGVNSPEGVFSIGTYGTWGSATYGVPGWKYDRQLFWQHTDNYARWFQQNLPATDYFLYLEDEPPPQDFGTVNTWGQWIKQNPGPGSNMSSLATYPFTLASRDMPDVDIPVMAGGVGPCLTIPCNNTSLNQTWADYYRTSPRHKTWAYNAGRPGTGTFMTEDDGIAPRMIPWAQYKMQIGRWFYWYANVNSPLDFYQQAVTWGDNQFYDYSIGVTGNNGTSNGDGLIVYPGSTVYPGHTNYQLHGPIASVRMKEWRRGIQDVDYLTLAAKYDPAATAAVVSSTVPKVLWEYTTTDPSFYVGQGPAWSSDPDTWEAARKRLIRIIVDHCSGTSQGSEVGSPCTYEQGSSSVSGTGTDPSNTIQTTTSNPPSNSTSPTATGLVFVPISPCRVVDTRQEPGDFGAPFLLPHETRTLPMLKSSCNIPANAQSYALNVTVVPHSHLDFLTIYPAGNNRPNVSLINSQDGRIKASAMIVPAGDSGDIAAFATDPTELIIDINGYFVSSGIPNGLRFFPVKPCRLFDTRSKNARGGGTLKPGEQRDFDVLSSPCGIPASAKAYSVNYTAVPSNQLAWMTAWPAGEAMPSTSTLNAPTGVVTANGSITPAGSNGLISVYVTNETDLIADINGYFAQDATGGLALYNITPCRVFDSRASSPSSSFGTMSVDFVGATCGIPTKASAVVTVATVVPLDKLDFLSIGSPGSDLTGSSILNAYDGQITSNLAISPVSGGLVSVFTTDHSYIIFDVFGYFAP